MPRISLADYRSLAAFRYEIRKFLAFSEGAAREAGIEPQQHQMLLAVRGLPDGTPRSPWSTSSRPAASSGGSAATQTGGRCCCR
jgi:hypothetical protein